jgi:hypothetical protein
MSKTTPHLIARASTIRMSIAAAERRMLELDCPKERAAQREHIEALRLALRAAR